MKTIIILGLILGVFLIATIWSVLRSYNEVPSVEILASPTSTTREKVRFVSPDTNEVVEVTFSENTAVLNGKGYQQLSLVRTETASGARYESTLENVSIWNKGAEVTIYRGREIIFSGFDATSVSNNSVSPIVVSDSASSSESREIATTTRSDTEQSSTTEVSGE